MRELYGIEVSPELISKVTDAVLDELAAWQSRPLDTVHAIVYFDAVRVKIRDEGLVRNKAVYLAFGYTCDGHKQILGMWVEQTKGAKFRLSVMNDLKARGLKDILIAVVDGPGGFPEAIETAYPRTLVQTRIVRLIRNSMAYGSRKERKHIAAALRAIYQAIRRTPTPLWRRWRLSRRENGAGSIRASPRAGGGNGSGSFPSSPSRCRSAGRSTRPTPLRA